MNFIFLHFFLKKNMDKPYTTEPSNGVAIVIILKYLSLLFEIGLLMEKMLFNSVC